MSEYIIYHNPKCTKSRQTLALLEENGIQPKVVEYLKDAPTKEDIKAILEKLTTEPATLVRVKEDEFKNNKFDVNDKDQIIENLVATPKLLERPVVIHGNRAIIGRPPENVKELI